MGAGSIHSLPIQEGLSSINFTNTTTREGIRQGSTPTLGWLNTSTPDENSEKIAGCKGFNADGSSVHCTQVAGPAAAASKGARADGTSVNASEAGAARTDQKHLRLPLNASQARKERADHFRQRQASREEEKGQSYAEYQRCMWAARQNSYRTPATPTSSRVGPASGTRRGKEVAAAAAGGEGQQGGSTSEVPAEEPLHPGVVLDKRKRSQRKRRQGAASSAVPAEQTQPFSTSQPALKHPRLEPGSQPQALKAGSDLPDPPSSELAEEAPLCFPPPAAGAQPGQGSDLPDPPSSELAEEAPLCFPPPAAGAQPGQGEHTHTSDSEATVSEDEWQQRQQQASPVDPSGSAGSQFTLCGLPPSALSMDELSALIDALIAERARRIAADA